MDFFRYQDGELYAESVPVKQLAQTYGTPLYIYSKATLLRHVQAFKEAFAGRDGLVCYAVKANSNLAILQLLSQQNIGFDIVSGGELARVIAAGADPHKVIFSGVGKTEEEIEMALEAGILCFNVESAMELDRINLVAGRMGKVAPISFRINPNVDAHTHPYISTGLKENKFGIPVESALAEYQRAAKMEHVEIVGLDFHIGSQLTEISPYIDAIKALKKLIRQLYAAGIKLHHLDIGGGLGVTYSVEAPPLPNELLNAAYAELEDLFDDVGTLQVVVEPGRSIVANAGIFVYKVEFTKDNLGKKFAIVDAGMNDNIRPSLYGAFMNIITVEENPEADLELYDVVGPVCETGDFQGKNRQLRVRPGDFLAMRGSGAYCSAMASQYNSRPKCAEVLVDGDKVHVIRERETYEDLWAKEKLLEQE
ncbi:diaminopimelate decarboxylase [Psittacicella melopsittaci]|uniref:Diaminopimelate decarboxylase n=1 Tax=Psittacicella melopsittaci TaxID=2028576 RepID=A0A3A1YCQ1_9GAMM|nr:diaminopimelate decarboxylase [Psittacicella melopsittaci]RIY33907.1 diaminopimelate decarboxylase [Psittacicella melopsittaci]